MSKNANSAGNIIKEARESYNYTTEECAEKLGISTRYLQKIENEGNLPSYGTLRNIVQLFSIDANYLFYDEAPFRLVLAAEFISNSELLNANGNISFTVQIL